MAPSIIRAVVSLLLASCLTAAAENDGYQGYRLNQKGDPESTIYKTANTNTAPAFVLPSDPDVYLNATVDVRSIHVDVRNIVAKVNLDAKVMDLLEFSAGVDASIDRVELRIDDVYAQAELEARLGNVVRMVDDVLGSIDLNPILASVGQNVKKVVGGATGVVGGTAQGLLGGEGGKPTVLRPGSSSVDDLGTDEAVPPAYKGPGQENVPPPVGTGTGPANPPPVGTATGPAGNTKPPPNPALSREPNILSLNTDPSTNGATYWVLEPNGDMSKVTVDARGTELSRNRVGSYKDMQYLGGESTVMNDNGQVEKVFPFRHAFPNAVRICHVYMDSAGRVTRTSVVPWDGKTVMYDQEL